MTAKSVYNDKGDGYGAGTDGGGLNGYCSINKQGSSNLNFKVGGDYKVLKCKAQDGTDYELNGLESIPIETEDVLKPWEQPTLNENGTLGGNSFAVADVTHYGDRYAYKGFNGDTNGYLGADTTASNNIVTFYNPNPLKISSLYIKGSTNRYCTNISIQGSNDGSDWTTLLTGISTYTENTLDLSSYNAYKYFRIYPNVNITTSLGYGLDLLKITIVAQQVVSPVLAGDYTVMAKTDKSTYLDQTPFYRQPNKPVAYSELGNPSVDNNYLASNFSSRNAIIPDKKLATGSNSWEIETVVKTGSDVSTQQNIFGDADNVDYKTPVLSINSSNYNLYASSNGSSWDIASSVSGSYSVPANNTEYIKYGWDGTKYYVKNKQDIESKSIIKQANLPIAQRWQSVTYGNGKFVAVASNSNTGAYSTDGITWTTMTLPSSQSWYSVTYGNGKFVAVALGSDSGAYSTDGITWTTMSMPNSVGWDSVTYGNGKFVAVAYDSNISAYSVDGITWTSTNMPSSQNWYAVTYGNGKFVAVVYDSDTGAYSTDGITWTTMTLPSSQNWYSVTYGNGKFVAVVYDSDTGAYSTDGITWTTMTLPSSQNWYSVTYGNDKFVAVATNSFTNAYSTDGINWTASTRMSYARSWISVIYGNDKFVAITYGMAISSYSMDGITWSTSGLPSSAWWNSVTYGNGTYVTVATNTNTASYSTDGASWTASTLPTNQAWTNVFYGNGKFITIADSSATASYSTDGITWTSATLPTSNIWVSGAYGNSKYVITASSTSTFAYSSDGITWTSGTMPSLQDWMATTFGNNKFVSLANDSNIFAYSTDGVTWVQSTLPTSQEWVSVAYGNGKFVAVATGSTTGVYSEDGVNWTTMTLPSSSQWKAVYYGKDRFVAISYESNVIAWSKDGISWTPSTLPASLEYCSITYGNKFVITANSTQSVINLEYNFDWVEDITVTSSTPIYQSSNNWAIGNNLISSSSQYPFLGSIDLKNTKVTVNNELYWNYDYGTYIWQDTSKLPVTVRKHNLTYWEDFNDLPIGRITVGSSGLSSVETFPYSSKAVTKASSTKPAMLINSYKNGTEWYYRYSDGWIEMGGEIAVTTSDKTVNLMGFTMKDTNYEIQALGQAGYIVCSKTTTTITVRGSSATTALWKVAGYLK